MSKSVIVQISGKQVEEMKHALGLNYKKRPYRNYFYCSVDDKDWNDLVEKGFATKHKGQDERNACFRLTYDATKLIYDKRISKKYYDEL